MFLVLSMFGSSDSLWDIEFGGSGVLLLVLLNTLNDDSTIRSNEPRIEDVDVSEDVIDGERGLEVSGLFSITTKFSESFSVVRKGRSSSLEMSTNSLIREVFLDPAHIFICFMT